MDTDAVIFVISQEKYNYSPDKVHIIGHSLGAHAAGEAGKRRPGIARITGESVTEVTAQTADITA